LKELPDAFEQEIRRPEDVFSKRQNRSTEDQEILLEPKSKTSS
jgi:hypothetical protein